ncbi:MAG: hypothetical protein ABJD07_12175 [Gemmatimonadaceae bacterium]
MLTVPLVRGLMYFGGLGVDYTPATARNRSGSFAEYSLKLGVDVR